MFDLFARGAAPRRFATSPHWRCRHSFFAAPCKCFGIDCVDCMPKTCLGARSFALLALAAPGACAFTPLALWAHHARATLVALQAHASRPRRLDFAAPALGAIGRAGVLGGEFILALVQAALRSFSDYPTGVVGLASFAFFGCVPANVAASTCVLYGKRLVPGRFACGSLIRLELRSK